MNHKQTTPYQSIEDYCIKYQILFLPSFLYVKKKYYFCSPFRKDFKIVRWCKGSTNGFGPFGLGSNPGRTTQNRVERKRITFCPPLVDEKFIPLKAGNPGRTTLTQSTD
jgi:hypothetical protein